VKTQLMLTVEYNPVVTDPESLATALDRLLTTACSTPGILDEYGNPAIGEVLVVSASEPDQDNRPAAPCECEAPGFYDSGVPGILAHRDDAGQVAPESGVERCDLCRRYPSDTAARARLVELGMMPQAAPPSRYVLYDFDADELATTTVYTDHGQAVDDASGLDNVIVVALPIHSHSDHTQEIP